MKTLCKNVDNMFAKIVKIFVQNRESKKNQVDHVHKARTVVRSGGLNFDWDERFQLDLLNNMEVVVIISSIYQRRPQIGKTHSF